MATEDLCLVCTDSLDYTGFGPCGHKQACSRCVARLRFVMKDTRCMLCKQDNPAVFFTRYLGDYTHSLAPGEFNELQERSQTGELFCLSAVNGFFDDKDHFNTIKSLCSYTHPLVNGITFDKLGPLKRLLLDRHQLHFCDLCINGRKVFISEQVLYSKADLERHMRTGDDAGPLAESGFKGHPLCRFCHKRFYDGDELYRHMESAHETCFICKKLHPNKFVYYKDYAELDGHFQSDHFPCPHPSCLERKFVVFAEEQDLKRHFAAEHGNDANMSRAQRRQAMALNIQLTYASREEEHAAAAAAAALHRPGVVIGGGHGLQRGGRDARGGSLRHSHSEGAMQQALQASMDSSRAEDAARAAAAARDPGSVTFSAEDFPTVTGQGTSTTPLGTWVAAGSAPGGGASLTQEDFPALPSMSRNQRRRQRERAQQASMASRLAPPAAAIRVVNRAAAPTPAEAAASSSRSTVRHSQSAGNLLSGAGAATSAADGSDDDIPSSDGMAAAGEQQQDQFPALPGGPSAAAATQAHPAWVPVRRSGKPPKPGQPSSSSGVTTSTAVSQSLSDFPSLAASSRAATSARSSNSSNMAAAAGRSSRADTRPPAQTVAEAVSAAGGVSEQLKAANKALIDRCKAALSEDGFRDFKDRSASFMQGAVSAERYHSQVVQLGLLQVVPELAALCPDADKRAALVAAHKQYLKEQQDTLQAPAGRSVKGWVPPEAAMAALAEVEEKGSWTCDRCTLVNAPSSRLCEVCSAPKPLTTAEPRIKQSADAGASSSSKNKVQTASAASSSWSAAAAGRVSKGGSSSSQAVQQQQHQQQPPAAQGMTSPESWPGLSGGNAGNGSHPGHAASSGLQQQTPANGNRGSSVPAAEAEASSSQQAGKKKKGSKQPLSDLLASGKSHPQNAWTQPQRMSSVVSAPTGGRGSMGQWGKQGGAKLAKSINAYNEAWSKK